MSEEQSKPKNGYFDALAHIANGIAVLLVPVSIAAAGVILELRSETAAQQRQIESLIKRNDSFVEWLRNSTADRFTATQANQMEENFQRDVDDLRERTEYLERSNGKRLDPARCPE